MSTYINIKIEIWKKLSTITNVCKCCAGCEIWIEITICNIW